MNLAQRICVYRISCEGSALVPDVGTKLAATLDSW